MATTQLSVTATPGRRYAFIKLKGEGPFTALSIAALPGCRHVFTAKTGAATVYTLVCASGNINLSGTAVDLLCDVFGESPVSTAKALNCGWRFNRNRSSSRSHSSKKISRHFRGNCWKRQK